MIRRIAALLGLLLTALAAAGPAEAAPRPPLEHSGRWITDADGRVVVLHGWNMVYKHPPYQPVAAGFGRDDARFLARHGFNTIRLGVIYAGLEPEPGEISRSYLDQTAETVRLLTEEGIFVLLDFHQDMYNERFEGEGFPDWAVVDEARTVPAEPKTGFPGNYVAMPALQRAYDYFWQNAAAGDGARLQDAFAAAWRRVAERFRGQPHVLGYNFLNEPWPGSQWPSCANPAGCPAFDAGFLTPFSQRVTAAIREVDRRTLVWYAPNVLFDFGADTHHGDIGDPRAGLAFNMYCLVEPLGGISGAPGVAGPDACETGYELTLDNAEAHSRETGAALIMTEFAATDDLDVVRQIADIADERMLSWQQWHYCACDDPTTTADPVSAQALVVDPSRPPRGDNVKQGKLRASARPYPQAVAGTPRNFGFDFERRTFELRYSTERLDGGRFPTGSVTEIFVPRLHYGDGYAAEADGARVASEAGAAILRLRGCKGAKRVTVRVRPRGSSTRRCPDRRTQPEGKDDGREGRGAGAATEVTSQAAERGSRRGDQPAATGGGGSGSLAFTGLAALGLLVVAAGLLAVGAALRRASRQGGGS